MKCVARARIAQHVSKIVEGRATESVGGDHSVSFPLIAAFEKYAPLTTALVDANRDRFLGLGYTNSRPFRRARGRSGKPS